jgi:hypothetical protein
MSGRATPEELARLVAERIVIDYEVLADKLAERLRVAAADAPRRISAAECSRLFGYSPRWWREHKAEFGAVPMAEGPRPRLGFDPAEVERELERRRDGRR